MPREQRKVGAEKGVRERKVSEVRERKVSREKGVRTL
jgi:hypothetical protein